MARTRASLYSSPKKETKKTPTEKKSSTKRKSSTKKASPEGRRESESKKKISLKSTGKKTYIKFSPKIKIDEIDVTQLRSFASAAKIGGRSKMDKKELYRALIKDAKSSGEIRRLTPKKKNEISRKVTLAEILEDERKSEERAQKKFEERVIAAQKKFEKTARPKRIPPKKLPKRPTASQVAARRIAGLRTSPIRQIHYVSPSKKAEKVGIVHKPLKVDEGEIIFDVPMALSPERLRPKSMLLQPSGGFKLPTKRLVPLNKPKSPAKPRSPHLTKGLAYAKSQPGQIYPYYGPGDFLEIPHSSTKSIKKSPKKVFGPTVHNVFVRIRNEDNDEVIEVEIKPRRRYASLMKFIPKSWGKLSELVDTTLSDERALNLDDLIPSHDSTVLFKRQRSFFGWGW